jgi:GDPmannose 4,6-dehydratase
VLVYGDLSDGSSLSRILRDIQPHEIYNLGAQSHVRVSFDTPEYTADITGLGAIRLLEAIRESTLAIKFYQASSSELYGNAPAPQNELTPFDPRSPYAAAKAYAYYVTRNYREAYGMYAVNGILFNHESPRRGETFVTRKITRAVANIKYGRQKKLYLGNLEARRDWGFAQEYVEAMWKMLQQAEPSDYVIATGETHSVQEFVEAAFHHVDLNWREFVEIDPAYFRPSEVNVLLGDATKAQRELNWKAEMTFPKLVQLMVESDLNDVKLEIEGKGR